jgi:hypothetical protein
MTHLEQGSWDYVVDRMKNGYYNRPVIHASCYYGIGDHIKHFGNILPLHDAKVVFYKLNERYYHGAIELPDGQIFECNVPDNFRNHGVEQTVREVHTIPDILKIIKT